MTSAYTQPSRVRSLIPRMVPGALPKLFLSTEPRVRLEYGWP